MADDDDDHLEREIERSGEITEEVNRQLPDDFRPLAESVFGGTSGPEG